MIRDFEDGKDLIVFHSPGQHLGFDDLDVSQAGDSTIIAWSLGTISLEGIGASQITADDFDFM